MTAVLLKLLSYDHLYDRNVYEYLFLFEEQVRAFGTNKLYVCSFNSRYYISISY